MISKENPLTLNGTYLRRFAAPGKDEDESATGAGVSYRAYEARVVDTLSSAAAQTAEAVGPAVDGRARYHHAGI